MSNRKHSPSKKSTHILITGVELGFAAEELILAVFCSKEPDGIFWAGRATRI